MNKFFLCLHFTNLNEVSDGGGGRDERSAYIFGIMFFYLNRQPLLG